MSVLWSKQGTPDEIVQEFTVGRDREFDIKLARYDILGTMAHIRMLKSISLLTGGEETILLEELNKMIAEVDEGKFVLEDGVEDIHSQVEFNLTKKTGDIGKKIHSGRSRNDQVLVDIKLFLKNEIHEVRDGVSALFALLQKLSEQHRDIMLPGYTHSQIAMPSTFGLWFGAYAESLTDDLYTLVAAYNIINQNPLGSAAGYGSSFPIDRELTTSLLGFAAPNYNSVAAQMSRGKSERAVAFAISSIASTLNKLSSDCIVFMNGNYGFISFPDELTTGSSIMPHKKNPDVWELIRAYSNRILSVPNEIALLTTNLTHGYHRDFQLLKEILFPALDSAKKILSLSVFMLENIRVNKEILNDNKYDYLFTVEEVNKRVLAGVPFREAYKSVGLEVNSGTFVADKKVTHTHIGSMGNLCNAQIEAKFSKVLALLD
ncbi:MAG: argininosuccinate lyase [Bacteroidales bacterium]|nr:argininosuccinate lyase [Bacteroidales bacterium]